MQNHKEHEHNNRVIIGITGSAGKTTTKEMLASILEKRWNIIKTRSNRNYYNHTARNARLLSQDHQAAVLEYGLLYEGDITKHCKSLQPTISIITNVGSAHLEHFGSLANLAKAKSEIIYGMDPVGTLFINADDQNSLLLHTSTFEGEIITIGINQPAVYQASTIQYMNDGMLFDVEINNHRHQFQLPIFGTHNIYNALFAISVSHYLGFTVEDIKAGLQSFKNQNRRLTIYPLTNGIRIIDDTFSANPQAVKAAIDVLINLEKNSKIAVLGSMLQLGDHAKEAHQEIGRFVAENQLDYLVTYGREAKEIGNGARAAGFPPNKIKHFSTKAELRRYLQTIIKPNTTILVKGSHSMGMNRIVKFLRMKYS